MFRQSLLRTHGPHGPRRSGRAWLTGAIVLGLGSILVPAGGAAAPKAIHCKSSQVKQTVTYVKRRGAAKRTVTGCGAPAPKVPALTTAGSKGVVPPVLRTSRRTAVKAAPPRIVSVLKRPAARRVQAADHVTDGAIDDWFVTLGGGALPAPAALRTAHIASSVQTGSDNGPADGVPQGPAGTKTTMHRSGTEWGDASPNAATGVVSSGQGPEQNPGFDGTITTETTNTRVHGAASSTTKSVRIKVRMARCPDAAGVGQGPVLYEEKSTQVIDNPSGGHTVIVSTSSYNGTLEARFNDDAQLISGELRGEWSYATDTRASSRHGGAEHLVSHWSVGGTSTDTRLSPGGNSLTVTTTSASDDMAAMGGRPTGTWVAGIMPPAFARDGLERIVANTSGGGCVAVLTDPTSLKLRSGETATISAHLTTPQGPMSGHVTTNLSGGTLTPTEAEANPDASFTFTAPAGKQEGEFDIINFNHVSRRGRANGFGVRVDYLPAPPSHTYRVMAATLDETVTAQRPAGAFTGCPPFSGVQNNTMTLGPQPAPTAGFATQGHLLDAPQGYIGQLIALGTGSATTTMHGCDLATHGSCTTTGAGPGSSQVSFEVTLPKTGPAQLRWHFGFGPTAGLGSEGAGTTCLTPPIGWQTTNFALGDQTVPRAIFEAATPQQLSFAVDFDLTDPTPSAPAQIHAGDRYTMTIQRVRDDGSPL